MEKIIKRLKSFANAAGRVLLAMIKQVNAKLPRELLQKARLEPKRFCTLLNSDRAKITSYES